MPASRACSGKHWAAPPPRWTSSIASSNQVGQAGSRPSNVTLITLSEQTCRILLFRAERTYYMRTGGEVRGATPPYCKKYRTTWTVTFRTLRAFVLLVPQSLDREKKTGAKREVGSAWGHCIHTIRETFISALTPADMCQVLLGTRCSRLIPHLSADEKFIPADKQTKREGWRGNDTVASIWKIPVEATSRANIEEDCWSFAVIHILLRIAYSGIDHLLYLIVLLDRIFQTSLHNHHSS